MIKFTKEYVGGLLAGFGFAASIARFCITSEKAGVLDNPFILVGGLMLMVVGGSLALNGQRAGKR
ncbi:hypothetical protein V2O64_22200 [Verrucomicrobiaceae bacterium 227]